MSESQRRFPRVSSHHSVLVTKLADGAEEFALTKTIALGGCSVVSNESLGSDGAVELLIAIDADTVIKARGRVVYERAMPDGKFEVGVEFVHMNDEDARHIERLFEPRQRPHAPRV